MQALRKDDELAQCEQGDSFGQSDGDRYEAPGLLMWLQARYCGDASERIERAAPDGLPVPDKRGKAMSKLTGDETGHYNPWTPEEDALILAAYKEKGSAYIEKRLQGNRTRKSIERRASRLGATQRLKTPRKKRDTPLVTKREEKRNTRSCFGYIPSGPAPSIFHLAEAITSREQA